MSEEDKRPMRFHLDPKFTIGQILTIASCFAAMLWYVAGQDTRISLVEQAQSNHERVDAERESRAVAVYSEIRTTLRRIEDKIDKKADKQ